MKFILGLLLAVVLAFNTNGVKAASTTEEVCTTDSYGNRSCSSSTSTTSTSEVTYGTGGDTTTSSTEILNTSMPVSMQIAAGAIVVLGATSLILKKKIIK